MASFKYLWLNRAKFRFLSKDYIKAWAKRILLIPELLQRNGKRNKLLRRGANIAPTAEMGQIKIEGPLKYLSVGNSSFLGRVNISLHDAVVIGNNVCINDDVEILTGSHDVMDPEWKHIKSPIIIEDYAWIGTGAMLLPGVHIGRGAVVGARAVVSKSVAAGAIVVGNPAKPIQKTRIENLTYNPCEFLAANRAWLVG